MPCSGAATRGGVGAAGDRRGRTEGAAHPASSDSSNAAATDGLIGGSVQNVGTPRCQRGRPPVSSVHEPRAPDRAVAVHGGDLRLAALHAAVREVVERALRAVGGDSAGRRRARPRRRPPRPAPAPRPRDFPWPHLALCGIGLCAWPPGTCSPPRRSAACTCRSTLCSRSWRRGRPRRDRRGARQRRRGRRRRLPRRGGAARHPGRVFDWWDVAINVAAALLGGLVCAWWRWTAGVKP